MFIRIIVFMCLTSFSVGAHAGLCVVDKSWDGVWENRDKNTRSITTLSIKRECQTANISFDRGGGLISHRSGVKVVFHTKAWGKCHPKNCYWGSREGMSFERGAMTDRIKITYKQGFADKTLRLRKTNGNQHLLVHLYNVFKDKSGRKNYSNTLYFTKRR